MTRSWREWRHLPAIEREILPRSCDGRVSTSQQLTDSTEPKTKRIYRITVHLGCAGLVDGLADISVNEYPVGESPQWEQPQNEQAALRSSASQIINACAECALGSEGQKRISARMRAPIDDIQTQLETAQAQQRTAEAQLEIERLRHSPQ